MTARRQGLAVLQEADGVPDGSTRLFRAVLLCALGESDAHEWLNSVDAELVCQLADLDRSAVAEAFHAGRVKVRKPYGPKQKI